MTDEQLLHDLEEFAKDMGYGAIYKNALDLIHRLQSDNERLLKDYYAERQTCDEQKAEIERLTEDLEEAYATERDNIRAEIANAGTSCHWCLQQAVKDTAKEILQELWNEMGEYKLIGIDKFEKTIVNLENRYGVEVE